MLAVKSSKVLVLESSFFLTAKEAIFMHLTRMVLNVDKGAVVDLNKFLRDANILPERVALWTIELSIKATLMRFL